MYTVYSVYTVYTFDLPHLTVVYTDLQSVEFKVIDTILQFVDLHVN